MMLMMMMMMVIAVVMEGEVEALQTWCGGHLSQDQ